LFGYGLAAVSKFAFPLAPTLAWIVGARFADRVGKGIRGAPRDALIADITPANARGRSFGLRQALDTVGAIGGPLLAIGAMAYFVGDFRAAFWIAVVPALLAVMLIVVGVDEPDRTDARPADSPRLRLADIRRLPRSYVIVVTIAAVLTLARFSEAFLVLRAQNIGFSDATAPLVMVAMAVVYAATSYPAGALADRGHGARLLSCGLAALVAADLVLAYADSRWMVLAGASLWGLHMGLTQGLLSALVAFGACGPARHGIRRLQSHVRHRAAGGQWSRRLALGRLRPALYVLRGRGVHGHRLDRLLALRASRRDAAARVIVRRVAGRLAGVCHPVTSGASSMAAICSRSSRMRAFQ
jgi:MFS family permease